MSHLNAEQLENVCNEVRGWQAREMMRMATCKLIITLSAGSIGCGKIDLDSVRKSSLLIRFPTDILTKFKSFLISKGFKKERKKFQTFLPVIYDLI